MKGSRLFALLLCGAILTAAVAGVAFRYYVIADYLEVGADVIVTDHIGFNLDPDAIHFGGLMPGSGASRQVNLSSTFAYPIRAVIRAGGNISDMLHYSENNIIIPANSTASVAVSVNVPYNTTYGYYGGKIKIFFFRVW